MFPKAPERKIFVLKSIEGEFEQGKEPQIIIRQAMTAEYEALSQFIAEQTTEYDERRQTVGIRTNTNPIEFARNRAYYCIVCSINILMPDGTELFPAKRNEQGEEVLAITRTEFNKRWGGMPIQVAKEINQYVVEVNPTLVPNYLRD